MRSRSLVLTFVVMVLTFNNPLVDAWGATGHMITAQIAYDNLNERARAEVDRLIAVFQDFEPRYSHMVPASVWADSLRGYGLTAFNRWHYIDRPFNHGGLDHVPASGDENVVLAIRQAVETLKSDRAADFQKALMLRLLVHFVGDVHQPLHCISRYTAPLPKGDRGGNDFALGGEGSIALHSYWDGTAGLYPAVDHRDPSLWRQQIPKMAKDLQKKFPSKRVAGADILDPDVWAGEGYRLAVDVVYDGVSEGRMPGRSYEKRARKVIRQRLVLGGYRLAAVLNDALGGE